VEVQKRSITKTKEGADITARAEEVKPHIDKAYEEFRSKADLKGFRKGKAPLSLIKKMYGDAIENDAISDLVNHFYRQAMIEHDLKPVGEPELKKVDYNPGQDFTFSVEYEVLPEIELQEYKNIEVEKPVKKVTDDMVERELKAIRQNYATRSETDAVTDMYHTVTADVQDLDESGMPIIGKRQQDVVINLFDERYEKDFIAPLLNAEKDGEYVIRYEHDHGEHKHTVNIKASVKKIEKLNLPEIDDAFVKEQFKNKFSSAEELENDIRSQLRSMFEEEASRTVRNKIADEIVNRHDFPVPEALIMKVFDQMIEEIKGRTQNRELPAGFDRHAFEAEYYTQAQWQAKWSVLREKLFEAEKIEIADSDIEAQAKKDAAMYGLGADQVLQYYKTSDQIRDKLMHDKLMEKLESYARITETEAAAEDEKPKEKKRIIQ
jgi:trigger factor